MTPGERTAAQAEMQEGRAVWARLGNAPSPEDAAAGILELWAAVEAAMRAMLGGSSLSGQAVVHELRQRNLLSLDQANGLATFWDARTRVDDTQYKPTPSDVSAARAAYNMLTAALLSGPPAAAAPVAAPAAPPPPPSSFSPASQPIPPAIPHVAPSAASTAASAPAYTPSAYTEPAALPPKPRNPLFMAMAAAVVVVVAALVYFMFLGGSSSYDRDLAKATDLMQANNVEAARGAFAQIAREHPERATPHVFLSRLARMDGNMPKAREELDIAIRTEPNNTAALREMGILLLAQNNAELARRFLVRASERDPADPAAQGYLGCALIRLNRVDEGQRFLARAGPGTWSACAPQGGVTR